MTLIGHEETLVDFDEIIDRRNSDSAKWNRYDGDVIPAWTADMDFLSPPPVTAALQRRVAHGVFGYSAVGRFGNSGGLQEAVSERYRRRHGLDCAPDDVLIVPGVVSGLYAMSQYIAPDESILIQTPNYWPFFSAAETNARATVSAPLVPCAQGPLDRYEIDFDALEAAIQPHTRMLMFCNPHNPVGRAYRRDELERLADICLRHRLVICSDEIHAGLTFPDHEHLAIAGIDREVAACTVTLNSSTKSYNLAGFKLGVAIATSAEMRDWLGAYYQKVGVYSVSALGLVAAEAAFRQGQPWLDSLLAYLQDNRDYAIDFVLREMPALRPTCPEATYLLLLDCAATPFAADPVQFFLDEARVALSGNFGPQGYPNLARLNFGCPRATLTEMLERMAAACARA
ncbi:MAG: PatB family C-S lyase [Anaerolineaceae bacterium]|nr:PatB family C-S lyase [Anaerolineaceae bacterium]MDE0330167.1 PatB family C-S lyase [Anaerolineaceae bacterium]